MNRRFRNADASNNDSLYNFSKPYNFSFANFGNQSSKIKTFVLNPSIAELKEDFSAFQELIKFKKWPVTKIIQRDIDTERVDRIVKGYLNVDEQIKYFPPLTCVLLPIAGDGKPKDRYGESNSELIKEVIDVYIGERYKSSFQELLLLDDKGEITNQLDVSFIEKSLIAYGESVFSLPYDSVGGKVFWNKSNTSAVIIDGQHRRQALLQLSDMKPEVNKWTQPVQIIDIQDAINIGGAEPIEIVRDIFLAINKTPVLVDEARMILMNDNDLMCQVTQSLIDDSEEKSPLPSEIVDWYCEGAKFSDEYLTGIIPLFHIIKSVFFGGKNLESFRDAKNEKIIMKFHDQLNTALVGSEFKFEGKSLEERIAQEINWWKDINEIGDDYEENDEIDSRTIFSLSRDLRELCLKRFKELYFDSIEIIFNKFAPYSMVVEHAKSMNVFSDEASTEIITFLRSNKKVKEKLLSESAEVKAYCNGVRKLKIPKEGVTIFHTVMGQKALLKGFLSYNTIRMRNSGVDHPTPEFITDSAKEYVEKLNSLWNVASSKSARANIFNLNFEAKAEKNHKEIKDNSQLFSSFWMGIIKKFNGEIDYGSRSIDLFAKFLVSLTTKGTEMSEFPSRGWIEGRHASVVSKIFEAEDEFYKETAIKIVGYKEVFLSNYLKENFE